MVQVFRQAGVGDLDGLAGLSGHDGIGRLEEEERRLTAGEAHFLGVLGVITADAENAPHRIKRGFAIDRHGVQGSGGEQKLGHRSLRIGKRSAHDWQ